MAPLDEAAWLEDVSAEAPAGPNVEFDPEFGALERAAQGKPGQQYGSTIIPDEEPDWRDVEAQAAALLERTRDLRVLCHLAVARLHLAGLAAYAAVLATVRQLLEARWEQIHPQLDPEDDNDPTLRANALLRLAHPGFVLKRLRDLPLAQSPRLGSYTWRDIQAATSAPSGTEDEDGDAEPPKLTEAMIRSAFQDSDAGTVAALRDAAAAAAAEAAAVPAAFEAHAGFGTGPDFTELEKLLREVGRAIDRYAPANAPAAEVPTEVDAPAADTPASAAAPAAVAVRAPAAMTATALTEVTTRTDALHLLDVAQRYFERFEPSSPLSLLIERSRRLADMSFLDILRDMAPDGLSQAQTVTGKRDE